MEVLLALVIDIMSNGHKNNMENTSGCQQQVVL